MIGFRVRKHVEGTDHDRVATAMMARFFPRARLGADYKVDR